MHSSVEPWSERLGSRRESNTHLNAAFTGPTGDAGSSVITAKFECQPAGRAGGSLRALRSIPKPAFPNSQTGRLSMVPRAWLAVDFSKTTLMAHVPKRPNVIPDVLQHRIGQKLHRKEGTSPYDCLRTQSKLAQRPNVVEGFESRPGRATAQSLIRRVSCASEE